MDYTKLSLSEVAAALDEIADAAMETFGRLDARQLNWRPDVAQWSVAQCFEHLVTANDLMSKAARTALDEGAPRSVWQRLPGWAAMLGPMMVRSQAPGGTRKYKAPSRARPAASEIDAGIVQRFADQQRETARWVRALDHEKARRTVRASPFLKIITYSVPDGFRLMVAHDHRHFEQARRVMQMQTGG